MRRLVVLSITLILIIAFLSGCNEIKFEKDDNEIDAENGGTSDEDGAQSNPSDSDDDSSQNGEIDSFLYVPISGVGLTQIVNYPGKSISLSLSGTDNDVTVTEETEIIRISLSGVNNIVRVSLSHSFTSNVSGVDTKIVYYDDTTEDTDDGDQNANSPPINTENITLYFEWDYPHDSLNKKTWTWTLSYPQYIYDYYSQLPRTQSYNDWADYTVDSIVSGLANGLKEAAENEGYDSYQTVSYILAFVQSLPYTEDDITTGSDDYPRYPIETLVDGGGDCEDTSFLFAGIIKELNYGVCLINPPGHVAVGVLGEETLSGTYYELDGGRYYYCETTGNGWEIGDCPDEYKNEESYLIKL